MLVSNLTGNSGKIYTITNPQLGNEINLFPNLDLAVLRISSSPNDQPFVSLEYGDVYEGEDIGIVGYPLAELRVENGNITFNGVLYRAARGCVTGRYAVNRLGSGSHRLEIKLIDVPFVKDERLA